MQCYKRDYFIIIISYYYDVCHNIFVICSALLDLQTLLSEKVDKHNFPLDMPRELVLQFDNCPENKVSARSISFLFCYHNIYFLDLL